jgi:hypothetical protein
LTPSSTPKFFFPGEKNLPAKNGRGKISWENKYLLRFKLEFIDLIFDIESGKRQKLNDSSANNNGDIGHKKSNGNGATSSGNAGDAKDSDKKKDKKKKSKKAKDDVADQSGVSAIKKPLSAYMLFNNARRPTL